MVNMKRRVSGYDIAVYSSLEMLKSLQRVPG